MYRRSYVAAAGTGIAAALAGCSLLEDPVVDETVIGDGTYPFDAEAGDTVEVEANIQQGAVAAVVVQGPEENILEAQTENEDTWERDVQNSGTHRLHVITGDLGQVDVTVTVN